MTDLQYQIALTLLPGIGDISGKKFVQYCGSAEAIFKETRKSLEKISGMREASIEAICNPKPYLKRAEQEMDFIEKNGIQPIFFLDSDYPRRLLQCDDGPMMLYYKGAANLNANRVVAIVGTRNITEYGKENCQQLVEDLKQDNVLIVSGLAYGVDTCAHKASLKNNIATIGVMGSGMQQIYPAPNKKLAADMVEQGGGILTELKGGSLITADIANSYNRDVFAYPGRVLDIYSQGCNYLIRTNRAHLMESVLNLRYIMRWDSETKTEKQTALFREFTDEEKLVMDCFGTSAMVNLDDIIVKTELPTTKIAALLLNLEFDGVLMAMPGKRYQKC